MAVLLAGHYGINPFTDVKNITVPPPQMVANMRVGNMDGYCVGEPWDARAIRDKIGFTAVTTQDIWKDHPEKVLGTTAEFVQKYPNTARAMIMAMLDASKYIDDHDQPLRRGRDHRRQVLCQHRFRLDRGAHARPVRQRQSARNGRTPNYMKFYNEGAVNFPYLSDGMWFLTQHKRWGLLKEDPDYLAVAKKINQIELYKQAAAQTKVRRCPRMSCAARKMIDGTVWDGKNPKAYAAGFKIKA